MEILDRTSGLLTNFEVLQMLQGMELLENEKKRKGLEPFIWVKEKVCQYLSTTPAATQTEEVVRSLFQQLTPFRLTQGEQMQIANLRPDKIVHLVKVVEECEERLTESKIQELTQIIAATPAPPEAAEAQSEEAQQEHAADAAEIKTALKEQHGLGEEEEEAILADQAELDMTGANDVDSAPEDNDE